MCRLPRLVCLLLLVNAQVLFSASAANVAASSVHGLSIRSQPALTGAVLGSLSKGEEVVLFAQTPAEEVIDARTGYWYRVLTMGGVYGWVFGGYLSKTAGGSYPLQDEEHPKITFKDYSGKFDNGKLVLVVVTSPEPPYPAEVSAPSMIFVRPDKGVPQVLFYQETLQAGEGDQVTSTARIADIADLLGDSRKEISVLVAVAGPDSSVSQLVFYGYSGGAGRYVKFGGIEIYAGGAGGPDGEYSSRVTVGPAFLVERGRRFIRLVRKTSRNVPVEGGQDGETAYEHETTYREETWGLDGDSLVLTAVRELPPPPSE